LVSGGWAGYGKKFRCSLGGSFRAGWACYESSKHVANIEGFLKLAGGGSFRLSFRVRAGGQVLQVKGSVVMTLTGQGSVS